MIETNDETPTVSSTIDPQGNIHAVEGTTPTKTVSSDKGDYGKKVSITETPIIPIEPPKPEISEKSSLLTQPVTGENAEPFEEIPEIVCGQLYASTLEVTFALTHKGHPIKSLPKQRVDTQGKIVYDILRKNQISMKNIELFMLGAGMMADWKYMTAYDGELKDADE